MADSSSTDPGDTPLLHRAGTVAAGIGSLGEGRPRLRAAIQYGLIALVFAFLAFFLITQWSKLPDYDWRFRPAWLVPAFLLVLTFYFLQPLLWLVILGGLGERGDNTQLRAAWGKSLVARYVPTSALMVVGPWKAEPTWDDRLGRFVGVLWMLLYLGGQFLALWP